MKNLRKPGVPMYIDVLCLVSRHTLCLWSPSIVFFYAKSQNRRNARFMDWGWSLKGTNKKFCTKPAWARNEQHGKIWRDLQIVAREKVPEWLAYGTRTERNTARCVFLNLINILSSWTNACSVNMLKEGWCFHDHLSFHHLHPPAVLQPLSTELLEAESPCRSVAFRAHLHLTQASAILTRYGLRWAPPPKEKKIGPQDMFHHVMFLL